MSKSTLLGTIEHKPFLAAVKAAATADPGDPILLVSEPGTLRVNGKALPATGGEPGTVRVPGKKLVQGVGSMPKLPLTLTYDGTSLLIRSSQDDLISLPVVAGAPAGKSPAAAPPAPVTVDLTASVMQGIAQMNGRAAQGKGAAAVAVAAPTPAKPPTVPRQERCVFPGCFQRGTKPANLPGYGGVALVCEACEQKLGASDLAAPTVPVDEGGGRFAGIEVDNGPVAKTAQENEGIGRFAGIEVDAAPTKAAPAPAPTAPAAETAPAQAQAAPAPVQKPALGMVDTRVKLRDLRTLDTRAQALAALLADMRAEQGQKWTVMQEEGDTFLVAGELHIQVYEANKSLTFHARYGELHRYVPSGGPADRISCGLDRTIAAVATDVSGRLIPVMEHKLSEAHKAQASEQARASALNSAVGRIAQAMGKPMPTDGRQEVTRYDAETELQLRARVRGSGQQVSLQIESVSVDLTCGLIGAALRGSVADLVASADQPELEALRRKLDQAQEVDELREKLEEAREELADTRKELAELTEEHQGTEKELKALEKAQEEEEREQDAEVTSLVRDISGSLTLDTTEAAMEWLREEARTRQWLDIQVIQAATGTMDLPACQEEVQEQGQQERPVVEQPAVEQPAVVEQPAAVELPAVPAMEQPMKEEQEEQPVPAPVDPAVIGLARSLARVQEDVAVLQVQVAQLSAAPRPTLVERPTAPQVPAPAAGSDAKSARRAAAQALVLPPEVLEQLRQLKPGEKIPCWAPECGALCGDESHLRNHYSYFHDTPQATAAQSDVRGAIGRLLEMAAAGTTVCPDCAADKGMVSKLGNHWGHFHGGLAQVKSLTCPDAECQRECTSAGQLVNHWLAFHKQGRPAPKFKVYDGGKA